MIIRAEKLTKKFESGEVETIAIRDIDLAVPKGEFLAITGRSGSGKSTLLYQLGLLDQPTSGEVYIEERKMSDLSSEERTNLRLRELGYVFQDYAIIPSLTALENVALPLLATGLPRPAAFGKAQVALEKIGLGHRLHNLPSQLSGGEQQRVSIARAIGHEPKIIFADEPTANLDSETSRVVLKAFLDLHREGQTIIMVTHEEEYATLAHRRLILSDGQIVEERKT